MPLNMSIKLLDRQKTKNLLGDESEFQQVVGILRELHTSHLWTRQALH